MEHKRVIAMGFFDGVHIGHGALLEKTKARALELGAEPTVLSFDVHPDTLVFGTPVPLITDCRGREELIRRCYGIEKTVFIHFNRKVMTMPWREFADSVIRELECKWVVVGHDFTFGNRGEGTAARLKEYLAEKGIGCDIIPPVMLDGQIVSSTYIRTLIQEGDMVEAARWLGHRHCLSDTVHSGYHIGHELEAPTINMTFGENVIVPKYGVYATRVVLTDGTENPAVTNIGVRPTFGEGNGVTVESHLLDFEDNLYGAMARVDFYSMLRPERRFESGEELARQIKIDAENARNALGI